MVVAVTVVVVWHTRDGGRGGWRDGRRGVVATVVDVVVAIGEAVVATAVEVPAVVVGVLARSAVEQPAMNITANAAMVVFARIGLNAMTTGYSAGFGGHSFLSAGSKVATGVWWNRRHALPDFR